MRCLLDTHLLLRLLAAPERVPGSERERLQRGSVVFYSVASLREIALERSLGRLAFDPETVAGHAERGGFLRVGIEPRHVDQVARLPWQHRDPFDRLLVAQSIAEPLTLLTVDRQLGAYGSTVRVLAT
ncbi:type II toxin-antitoxin system VapC family toxin [Zeimonas arvi]|uniref:Type II toxin-antitoxin system VapC family toxin n=1 Tax=Zeimonas arvi TaxID=2498847 RepID=A0A5C8NY49_9BURK|nr:type II toxin-antitoxin system VapC family toxin [Zeimonas arvi]TXL66041.1 type II toxin-antitoxin system VapC family toxin [Zeimonas arvi]